MTTVVLVEVTTGVLTGVAIVLLVPVWVLVAGTLCDVKAAAEVLTLVTGVALVAVLVVTAEVPLAGLAFVPFARAAFLASVLAGTVLVVGLSLFRPESVLLFTGTPEGRLRVELWVVFGGSGDFLGPLSSSRSSVRSRTGGGADSGIELPITKLGCPLTPKGSAESPKVPTDVSGGMVMLKGA